MPGPVVVAEVYEVAPGRDDDFYRWGEDILAEMAQSSSFLGGRVSEPDRLGEGRLVYGWSDPAVARSWAQSRTRLRWLDAAAPFARPVSTAPPQLRQVALTDAAVQPAAREPTPAAPPPAPPSPPPRWKTACVTLTAVFPPVLLFNVTLIPRLGQVHVVLRTLLLCVAVTAAVTWVMMPRLMPLFRGWLQAPTGGARPRYRRRLRAAAGVPVLDAGEPPTRATAAIGAGPAADLLVPAGLTARVQPAPRRPAPSRGRAQYLQPARPDRSEHL